jgi:hypothetical protein
MPELMAVPMQQCKQLDSYSSEIRGYQQHWTGPAYDDWMCTCKGYKYHGNCKHVKQAMEERCSWHEMYGAGQSDEQKQHMICPECGGETMWVSVGV